MKLATTIQPRNDGTVIARLKSGAVHRFKKDESGAVTCDVSDEGDIAELLALPNDAFFPADEADFGRAGAILKDAGADDGLGDDDDDDIDPDNPDGDQAAQPAPPIEANTPPKRVAPAKKTAGRKARAAAGA